MPSLPNYAGATRFNPRTGETTYFDAATGQWLPGLAQGQNTQLNQLDAAHQNPLPVFNHASPAGESSTGAGAPTPAGVAGSSTPSNALSSGTALQALGIGTQLAPQESDWSKNWAAMNNLLRTTPTLVQNGAPVLPVAAARPTGATGGAMGGNLPNPAMGGVAPQRAYVSSWGAPKQKEVRPWAPMPQYRR